MIRVTLPALTLGISFRHSKVDVPIPQTPKEKRDKVPVKMRTTMGTFCEIHEIKGVSQKWVCEASTILGVGDQFRKAEGRKIALTRALQFLRPLKTGERRAIPPIILFKQDRELIWSVYNNLRKVRVTLSDVKNVLKQEGIEDKELIETLRMMLEIKMGVKDEGKEEAPVQG